MLTCPKHPKYQAKRKPRADCERCRAIWLRQSFTAKLGPDVHCTAMLVIDHQSFNVGFYEPKGNVEWTRDQLAIALERIFRHRHAV